jgi:hypothetical protein
LGQSYERFITLAKLCHNFASAKVMIITLVPML